MLSVESEAACVMEQNLSTHEKTYNRTCENMGRGLQVFFFFKRKQKSKEVMVMLHRPDTQMVNTDATEPLFM